MGSERSGLINEVGKEKTEGRCWKGEDILDGCNFFAVVGTENIKPHPM